MYAANLEGQVAYTLEQNDISEPIVIPTKAAELSAPSLSTVNWNYLLVIPFLLLRVEETEQSFLCLM